MGTPRRFLVLAVLALNAAPASASTGEHAHAQLSFEPARPGASTTMTIAFQAGAQATLSPLARVELNLPAGLTGASGLGIATCAAATLETAGPRGCSPNSVMGRGTATVSVPYGEQPLFEHVAITIFMAPAQREHTTLLFYASGTTPIISDLVFTSTLLAGTPPYAASLDTTIPPVVGLPDALDASVISMRAGLGPRGVTYRRREHGRLVAYSPEGFDMPRTCPQGGFPFAATLMFADGARESATSRTPCPSSG